MAADTKASVKLFLMGEQGLKLYMRMWKHTTGPAVDYIWLYCKSTFIQKAESRHHDISSSVDVCPSIRQMWLWYLTFSHNIQHTTRYRVCSFFFPYASE